MTEKEWPEVLTPEQAAEFLGIDVKEVHRLIKTGELPFAKIGRHWRALRAWVEEYKYRQGAADGLGNDEAGNPL